MKLRLPVVALAGGLFLFMSPSGLDRAAATGWPACRTTQLVMTVGPQVSPSSGQNPLTLRLTNRAQRPCVLHGYPTIAFADERGSIPFPIRTGGDQMVTPSAPARVLVRGGRSAFVLVNKFRCDLGNVRVARTLRLGLADRTSPRLSLALRAYPRIAYCGTNPQSTVFISPFEPSVAATLRRR